MGITIPGNNPTSAMSVRYWKIGSVEYRETIRDGKFVTDKLLPGGAWTGAEDVGWENVAGVS